LSRATPRMLGQMEGPTLEDQLAALDSGGAFADLTMWRKIAVRGADAHTWLNDLLSADLGGLEPGSSRRSLLLSATGRVRAGISVLRRKEDLVLVQDPIQDTPIHQALEPYVLSSDVALEDVTASFGLLAFPGAPPGGASGAPSDITTSPSVLGTGFDVLLQASGLPDARRSALDGGLTEATPEAVEAWRILGGRARVGVDLGEDALPQEVTADDLIGYRKGCFLGQEAVAKVHNLGHPPFVLLAVTARSKVSAGDTVRADGSDAGVITSAEPTDDSGSAAIARVRWASRQTSLVAPDDRPLVVRGIARPF
jgi:folate-binding protein YgfZ